MGEAAAEQGRLVPGDLSCWCSEVWLHWSCSPGWGERRISHRDQLEAGPLTGVSFGTGRLVSRGGRGEGRLSFVLGQRAVQCEPYQSSHRCPQSHPEPEGRGSQLHGIQVAARKERRGQ